MGATIIGAAMLPDPLRYGVPFGTGNQWPKMSAEELSAAPV